MKCQNCDSDLKKVNVKVYRAKNKIVSYQCTDCDYFEFDPISIKKLIKK